jgi:hypothetical protein
VLFHVCEAHLSKSPPLGRLERLSRHVLYGIMFGSMIYFVAEDVTLVIKEPEQVRNGVLRIVSALCFVALGFFADLGAPRKKSVAEAGIIDNLPMAAMVLELCGAAIAVTNVSRELRIFSPAFQEIFNPLGDRELKTMTLERAMNLSDDAAQRLVACFQQPGCAECQFILGNGSTIELNISPTSEAAVVDLHGFLVILKPVVGAPAPVTL